VEKTKTHTAPHAAEDSVSAPVTENSPRPHSPPVRASAPAKASQDGFEGVHEAEEVFGATRVHGGKYLSAHAASAACWWLMSFWLHLFGTDLPIMIVIYSILMPRYFKLFSSMTAYLLDTVIYPTMHIFESGTRYDSIGATAMSLTFVYLFLIPAGLMKPFLTWRTGNAWVHVWAYHAISPHVTVDTRLIVNDFGIK
jgi:hypothetical protein